MNDLELLTKEELVSWIRENVPTFDEETVVRQMMEQRRSYALQKQSEFWDLHKAAENKVNEYIKPYIPAGAVPGTKIYNIPNSVLLQYQQLSKERDDIWREYLAWGALSHEASNKIIEINERAVNRKMNQAGGGK